MRENENQTNQIQFSDYRFMDQEGEFTGRFVGRWMNPSRNLECFFELDDGTKIRATTWRNRKYLNMDTFPVGGRCKLRFRKEGAGRRSYLREVYGVREDFEDFDAMEDSP